MDARIKWPDDIWVDERKLAGTMIDLVSGQGTATAIVGIGINVNSDPRKGEEELAKVATSVQNMLGSVADREQLLAEICNPPGTALGARLGPVAGSAERLQVRVGVAAAVGKADTVVAGALHETQRWWSRWRMRSRCCCRR